MNSETQTSTIRRIGFIGLGVMGGAMCRNIIRQARFESVTLLDSNPFAIQAVLAVGGHAASDLKTLVLQSDAIVLSLPDGKISASVMDQLLPLLKPGQLVMDTSTVPVQLALEQSKRCEAVDVYYLDAPVARTREAAETGTLSAMVGGSGVAFALAMPILRCIASDITHCGPAGSGQVVKILNNMVLFQTVNALSEAITIAERAGVSATLLADVFSIASADSFALRNHGRKSLVPGIFPERAFSTTYARKDNRYALELAHQVGVNARGAQLMEAVFNEAVDAGLSDQYFPVIHRLHGKV
jgi:3-hydroxyisobutyrate dehydrogenase